jgi:hypothetical protein
VRSRSLAEYSPYYEGAVCSRGSVAGRHPMRGAAGTYDDVTELRLEDLCKGTMGEIGCGSLGAGSVKTNLLSGPLFAVRAVSGERP